jgi:hypothetical protein
MNPAYIGPQQQYTGEPTCYNYPSQLVYGPTGVPMPHQYHPQVKQQLPFLAKLDLPYLSWLKNDPILHFPFSPVIPAKLPSDITKFYGKPHEDPNNHVMEFHLWCSSNSVMDVMATLIRKKIITMRLLSPFYDKHECQNPRHPKT